jgi:hypothetical protein
MVAPRLRITERAGDRRFRGGQRLRCLGDAGMRLESGDVARLDDKVSIT